MRANPAFDQRLAVLVAKPLARAGVAPNAITATIMAVGLGAGWLFAQGDPLRHWGAALFMVAVWMDHLDGEVARLRGRTSTFGHYFDHAAAMTAYISMFVGAGLGLGGGWLGAWATPAGIAAGLAVASIFTVRMWVEQTHGLASVKQTVHGGFEIEDTLYIFGPVTWLGLLPWFVAAAGIGAPLFLIYVLWDAWRK